MYLFPTGRITDKYRVVAAVIVVIAMVATVFFTKLM